MDKNDLIKMVFNLVKNHKITSEEGALLIKALRHDNSTSHKGEKTLNHYNDSHGGEDSYSPSPLVQDIAIIGLSGKFPDASNVNEYWNNLIAGRDSVREIPKTRWDIDTFYDPNVQAPNKSYSKWGGFLSDIDMFDPAFFKISPKEAELMDPQQRLFLQEAWSAFEEAGYSPTNLAKQKCGVFVGCLTGDYLFNLKENNRLFEAHSSLGNAASILAARIAYVLNLRGPSIAIDTDCSSALVAVHLACESIRSGTSELALAGGVMIHSTPQSYIWSSKAGLLSPTGKCRVFDSRADGMVLSEGVGVLVLKSLDAALKAGDHIHGIIKGSGINQDGKTGRGITVPNASAQAELECEVYNQYNIHPETISYVEAQSTGTKLGDPIEIEALTNAFRKYTHKQQYCAIGSVKTNIGHTQIAAGMAGLIKLLLCLKHKKLVPSLHFETENEHINFKDSPFYVNTRLKEWETEPNISRRAAISSFGASGTNAHLVVEEYESPHLPSDFVNSEPQLIVLSAKNADRLKAYAKKIVDFLVFERTSEKAIENNMVTDQWQPSFSLTDFAYTLQVGRLAMEERLAMVVSSFEEITDKLTQYTQGQTVKANFYCGNVKLNRTQSDLFDLLTQGKAGEAFLRTVIEEQELNRLAQLWVFGIDIDWHWLYPNHKPQRLSLPTYPFARERYWIPASKFNPKKPKAGSEQNQITKLHPVPENYIYTEDKKHYQKITMPQSTATHNSQFLIDEGNLLETIQQDLLSMAATISKISAKDIDLSDDLGDYGFDSISFTEFANQINDKYQSELITRAILFEYPSVGACSEFLCQKHPTHLLNYYLDNFKAVSTTPPTLKTAEASDVEGMKFRILLETLQKDLLDIAATILKINAKDIDWSDDLGDYGFDSISFTEFANTISDTFQLEITRAVLFEYPSVGACSEFLCQKYSERLLAYYSI